MPYPLAADGPFYVPFHPVRTVPLHLLRYMTVYVQGKGRRCAAQVALDGFYIVTVLERQHRKRVAEVMDTGVGCVNTDGQLFEVVIDRLRVQVRLKFIGEGAGARIRALSFFNGAKVNPPSFRGRFCSCLLIRMTPALKSTQSQVRPIASPSRRPVNRISLNIAPY